MNIATLPDIPLLRGPVPLSHLFLRTFLQRGEQAVDATCGNGGDTLLLAELAGPNGRVWAFDIQQTAIAETSRKLAEAGLAERVTLICSGHETLASHVTGDISAIVFNLGYLPGGDRTIITRPETTTTALEMSLECLKTGGVLAITIYPGHNGGDQEQQSVESWATRLPARSFHVWRMGQTNVSVDAPYFILIQKAA